MDDVSAIVVLDPEVSAPHSEVPASWLSLAADHEVVWIGSDQDAAARWDALVAGLDGGYAVVAGGAEAEAALDLAERTDLAPSAVLLVDPGTEALPPGAPALSAAEEWMRRTAERRGALHDRGTEVRLISASVGGSADRVAAPLPLGHPDVVAAVENALAGAESAEDFDDPEDFADAAGVDPTPEQVDEYRHQVER
ncbi:hypothetical protein [Actinokineospora bangkokensis]|uniref:Uncharacterized protein n=1 Tax=Actinokineospora bangkokensis TaxID=1193682 RepID=A0A1Q9LJY5_9PSEU|nr:hypothetical protein [Actinokineospora bangkokensis]OLR92352.1 hypothetical protein BJP25_19865 [Actinokineospora bangkokensis]